MKIACKIFKSRYIVVMENTRKDANLTPTQRRWKARRERWAAYKAACKTNGLRSFCADREALNRRMVVSDLRALVDLGQPITLTPEIKKAIALAGSPFQSQFGGRALVAAAMSLIVETPECQLDRIGNHNLATLTRMSNNPNTRANSSRV